MTFRFNDDKEWHSAKQIVWGFLNTYICSAHTAINLSDCSVLQDASLSLGQTCDLKKM